MTREQRLELLKQIEKDIYVPSIESTFLDDAKSCAIHSVIEELGQEPILDKICAEIETMPCAITSMKEIYVNRDKVIKIFDKYKAETGAEDGNNNL